MSLVHLSDAARNTGHTLDEPITVVVSDEVDKHATPSGKRQLAEMRALGDTRITVAEFIKRWPEWALPEWSYHYRLWNGELHGLSGAWECYDYLDKVGHVIFITCRYYTPDRVGLV